MVILFSLDDAIYWRFYFPVCFSQWKALITSRLWDLDKECLQSANDKPRSAYQMVRLLPLSGAPFTDFRFRSFSWVETVPITLKRGELDEECLQKRNSQPGSTYYSDNYWRFMAPPVADFSSVAALATWKSYSFFGNGESWTWSNFLLNANG